MTTSLTTDRPISKHEVPAFVRGLKRFLQTLLNPVAAFEADSHPEISTSLLALVVACAGFLVSAVTMPGLQSAYTAETESLLAAAGARNATGVAAILTTLRLISDALRGVLSPVGMAVLLWVAGVCIGTARPMGRLYRIALLSAAPVLIVSPLLMMAQMAFHSGVAPTLTSLAIGPIRFLDLEMAAKPVVILARALDLPTLWSLALVVVGLCRLPATSAGDALITAVLTWALPVLVSLATVLL